VVMDNEAGLEHISRRTASRVDHLIVVVNENPLSLDCARQIENLVAEIKNPVHSKYLLLNMVRTEKMGVVRDRVAGLNFTFLGSIPYDPQVEETIFCGRSLLQLRDGVAVAMVKRILESIGADRWK